MFLVFVYEPHNEFGGLNDLLAATDDLDRARAFAVDRARKGDVVEILDTLTIQRHSLETPRAPAAGGPPAWAVEDVGGLLRRLAEGQDGAIELREAPAQTGEAT